MGARYVALGLGIVYTLVGIVGFIPGLLQPPPAGAPDLAIDTLYGFLLGLFPVNVLHSLVHLAIGIWGIVAYRSFMATRVFGRTVAVVFGLLTIMGFFPVLQTTFGLIPLFGNDIWLHALTALAGAYAGWAERPERATTV